MCWSRSLPNIVSFAFTPTPAMRRWAHCGSPCTRFGTWRSCVHWRGWHDTSTSTMCHVAQGAIRNDNECKFQCADPGNDLDQYIGTRVSCKQFRHTQSSPFLRRDAWLPCPVVNIFDVHAWFHNPSWARQWVDQLVVQEDMVVLGPVWGGFPDGPFPSSRLIHHILLIYLIH